MQFTFNPGSIPWLLIVWAFWLGMGLTTSFQSAPFWLLIVGSALYLFSFAGAKPPATA